MVLLSLWSSGSCLGAPPPRRTSPHLVGSHEMRRNGEKLSPFLKSHEMERSSPGGVGVWSNPTRRQNPARFLANKCQCCYYLAILLDSAGTNNFTPLCLLSYLKLLHLSLLGLNHFPGGEWVGGSNSLYLFTAPSPLGGLSQSHRKLLRENISVCSIQKYGFRQSRAY